MGSSRSGAVPEIRDPQRATEPWETPGAGEVVGQGGRWGAARLQGLCRLSQAAERDWEEKRAALTQYSAKDINRLLEETQAELMKAIPDLDFAAKHKQATGSSSAASTPEHKPSKPQHAQKSAGKADPNGRRGSGTARGAGVTQRVLGWGTCRIPGQALGSCLGVSSAFGTELPVPACAGHALVLSPLCPPGLGSAALKELHGQEGMGGASGAVLEGKGKVSCPHGMVCAQTS